MPNRPPTDARSLAKWFAEGVRAELAALEKEKKGNSQNYELLSGRLIDKRGPSEGIYQFIIADGARIPEESEGRLITANEEYSVTVIGQLADRIDLFLQAQTLPPGIQRATLIIDDTALLRKLAEVLEEVSERPELSVPLAVTAFHPRTSKVGFANLKATPALAHFDGSPRRVAEQACGSPLTYIWGPPGTGKTYTIAHLVTALIEAGERVLVSSHTHAAVDQALYESVKSESGNRGPLASHQLVIDGKILRIGVAKTGVAAGEKIPATVRLQTVVERKGERLAEKLSELTRAMNPLLEQHQRWLGIVADLEREVELRKRLTETSELVRTRERDRQKSDLEVAKCKSTIEQRRAELEKAQTAWLWRASKTAAAAGALQAAEQEIESAERLLTSLEHEVDELEQALIQLEVSLRLQQEVCGKHPARRAVEEKLSRIALKLTPLKQEFVSIEDELSQLEQKVVREARAIFCTLTGLYAGNAGKLLEGQDFDAIIVDEISMALPPLIFLAASRAKRRVILVGDFLQLPPIVRGDTPLGDERLGTDVFQLAGVAKDLKPAADCNVLTKLHLQQRMRKEIADVARHLVYLAAGGLDDHPKVRSRTLPDWLEFLPLNPLVIVDTSDLHCWSGKQPGTLSRFNFDSATVAVQIAALAAARYEKPANGGAPKIGIVTPYTAQRRLLTKLIADLDLKDWVAAGTVHTFQGAEAELIIFDSVLDEPYWSARLCNPKDVLDVKRDLNVAITRAKDKFVFVGSSAWLNAHAKPTSALGMVWRFLKESAELISAVDLVNLEQFQRVFELYVQQTGWHVPAAGKGYTYEHLDEQSFFERFLDDVNEASDSIFGLAPYFGEYRWPRIQPAIAAALRREVKVTLVIPPLAEAQNRTYVEKVAENLRNLGAVVVSSSGLHGKDVIIDEKILYTGSMNWASNRGRLEEVHRWEVPQVAKLCLQFMQAKYIRQAAIHEDGTLRICPQPNCGWPLQGVNQRRQHGAWDFQPMKAGCTNPSCTGYLRNLDERPSFKAVPLCKIDGKTKYRRVPRGRGEAWQCPKHPKKCHTEKVVPGDPDERVRQRSNRLF